MKSSNIRIDIEWFRAIHHTRVPNNSWHAHSCLEIHFVTEGSNYFYFNSEAIEVKAGQAILIPANIEHRLENESGEPYFRYVLNVAATPLNDDPEALFLQNALAIEKPICMPIDNPITSLLESCLDEANERISGFLTIIQSNIQVILMSIARELTQTRKANYYITEKSNYDKQRVQHIIRYIEQSTGFNLVIQDIANYMHLSTKQVQRIVKSQYGLSVKQLMLQMKLKQAKELLKNANLSINAIAGLVGFSNEQCFNRFFQGMEGQTPGKYRNGILPRQMPNERNHDMKDETDEI